MSEIIKSWLEYVEQSVEDLTWTEINYYTTSKEHQQQKIEQNNAQLENKKAEVTNQARLETLDLQKSVVKNDIIKELDDWYKYFLTQLSSLPESFVKENKDEVEKEYQLIRQMIDEYKNDGEFKESKKLVENKIDSWINTLKDKKDFTIVSNAVHKLDLLKVDLWRLDSKDANKIEQEKENLKEKFEKENSESNNFTQMLTKVWIPLWIAWVLTGFASQVWLIDSNWGWWFSKIMNFIKNPVDWLMWLFWFWWKNKNTDNVKEDVVEKPYITNTENVEKDTESIKWKLTNISDWEKYTNKNITLEIKDGSFKEILIWNSKYEININNQPDLFLWNINIEQRKSWDILKIWDTEIDLIEFINQIDNKNFKNQYTLAQDFRLMWDLIIEKIT